MRPVSIIHDALKRQQASGQEPAARGAAGEATEGDPPAEAGGAEAPAPMDGDREEGPQVMSDETSNEFDDLDFDDPSPDADAPGGATEEDLDALLDADLLGEDAPPTETEAGGDAGAPAEDTTAAPNAEGAAGESPADSGPVDDASAGGDDDLDALLDDLESLEETVEAPAEPPPEVAPAGDAATEILDAGPLEPDAIEAGPEDAFADSNAATGPMESIETPTPDTEPEWDDASAVEEDDDASGDDQESDEDFLELVEEMGEPLEGEPLVPETAAGADDAATVESADDTDLAEASALVKEAVYGEGDTPGPGDGDEDGTIFGSDESGDAFDVVDDDFADDGPGDTAAAPSAGGMGAKLGMALLSLLLVGTLGWLALAILGPGARETQVAAVPPPAAPTATPAPAPPPAPVPSAPIPPPEVAPEPESAAVEVAEPAPVVAPDAGPASVAEVAAAEIEPAPAAEPAPIAPSPEPAAASPAPEAAVTVAESPIAEEPTPPTPEEGEPTPAVITVAQAPPPPPELVEPEPQPEAPPVRVARPARPQDGVDALRASLKINAIRYSQKDPRAIVNLQRVFEGDVVNGVRVVRIQADRILFEADGTQFTLRF